MCKIPLPTGRNEKKSLCGICPINNLRAIDKTAPSSAGLNPNGETKKQITANKITAKNIRRMELVLLLNTILEKGFLEM